MKVLVFYKTLSKITCFEVSISTSVLNDNLNIRHTYNNQDIKKFYLIILVGAVLGTSASDQLETTV